MSCVGIIANLEAWDAGASAVVGCRPCRDTPSQWRRLVAVDRDPRAPALRNRAGSVRDGHCASSTGRGCPATPSLDRCLWRLRDRAATAWVMYLESPPAYARVRLGVTHRPDTHPPHRGLRSSDPPRVIESHLCGAAPRFPRGCNRREFRCVELSVPAGGIQAESCATEPSTRRSGCCPIVEATSTVTATRLSLERGVHGISTIRR